MHLPEPLADLQVRVCLAVDVLEVIPKVGKVPAHVGGMGKQVMEGR